MKFVAASVVASLFIACGSEPGPTATIYVDPPTNGDACVGVAGFEVIIAPAGGEPRPTRRRLISTALAARDCVLPESISVPEVEIDAPVDVSVNGYDGTGVQVRVTGRHPLPNLRGGSARLQLEPGLSRSPLLVFHRNPLLEGVPLQRVTSMSISKPMGGTGTLLTVDRVTGGDFLDPEPGAYEIPGFSSQPPAEGTDLQITFTADTPIKAQRITVGKFNGTYYPAQ